MFRRGLALCMAFGLFSTVNAQTVNVNLVKTPDQATYTAGDVVTVDVFLSQDSGSSQLIRMVQLDLTDSDADVLSGATYPALGGSSTKFWDFTSLAGCPVLCGVNQNIERFPTGLRTNIGSITYLGLSANPAEQILLPDSTDVRIGQVKVTVPATGGTLNVVGSGAAPDAGAMVIWGFGVDTGDDEFRATVGDGNITGGSTTFPVGGAVNVVSSFPPNAKTLWRDTKNRIRITFDGVPSQAVALGDIEIVEMLPGAGNFGSDVSGTFTVTPSGADVVLQDTQSGLTNKKWYRIRSTGANPSIDVNLCMLVQAGDVTGDKFTNFTDLSAANGDIPTLPSNIDDSNRRSDVNGDNFVNFTDLSVANSFIPSFIVAVPAGHTCP